MGARAGWVLATLRRVPSMPAILVFAASPLAAQWSPDDPEGGMADTVLNRAGNCNGDASVDVADTVFLIEFLFRGGTPPACRARCDFMQDGALDLTDVIAFFDFMLRGGRAPVPLPEGICGSTINLRFSWSPVTEDILGNPETVVAYRMYLRSERFSGAEESPRTMVKQVAAECACATILDMDLPQIDGETIYIFSVTAVDAAGNESEPSNEVALNL